jgi:hypothetical protein
MADTTRKPFVFGEIVERLRPLPSFEPSSN